jgi:polyphenol oxidase
MIRKKAGNVEWLEFELFADHPGLIHGIFLRHGGVSEGPFSSLNAGGRAGDDPQKTEMNRAQMKKALNIQHFVSGCQVHGDEVVWVKQSDQELGDCDGLITQTQNLALMIKHADCQAAIFYDPIHHALGNVHCGWRGNVKNIYRNTVKKMGEIFGSRPEDLLVGISPSLGPNHSEFKNYKTEFPEEFWRFQVRPEYFDLWAIAKFQLESCGILPHHIQIAEICTFANDRDCFSYRRDKPTGNHATLAALS